MNVDEKKNGYKIRVLVQSLYMISFEKRKRKEIQCVGILLEGVNMVFYISSLLNLVQNK